MEVWSSLINNQEKLIWTAISTDHKITGKSSFSNVQMSIKSGDVPPPLLKTQDLSKKHGLACWPFRQITAHQLRELHALVNAPFFPPKSPSKSSEERTWLHLSSENFGLRRGKSTAWNKVLQFSLLWQSHRLAELKNWTNVSCILVARLSQNLPSRFFFWKGRILLKHRNCSRQAAKRLECCTELLDWQI